MKFCKKCQCETERYGNGGCKLCAKAYSAENRESMAAYGAAYRAANRERIAAKNAAHYAANRESLAAKNAAYCQDNPDKRKATQAAYQKANPEAMRINEANYRARKIEAGGTLSKGLRTKLFDLQRGKCACCGLPLGNGYHMDHVMPLKLGGTNTDDNIQLLRATCNHQKSAKNPIEFMQQRGKLL